VKLRLKIDQKKVVTTFFSGLFSIFIFATITLFTLTMPIINSKKWWFVFIIMIFIIPAVMLSLAKHYIPWIDMHITEKISIPIIFISAFLPRIIWINLVNVVPRHDFELYHNLAGLLINSTIEGNNYISLFPHVIGYPSVLSVFYRLFGTKIIVAQLLNVFLGCGIAFLIYLIGKKLLNETCGFIASLFWALWPSQIQYTSLVATEELFTFLNLLCMLFLFRVVEYKGNHTVSAILFGLLGILVSFANAIRPYGILILVAIAIYYFIFIKESCCFKKNGAIKIICYTILLSSYYLTSQVINYSVINSLKQDIAQTPVGFNLYVGSNIEQGGVWNEDDSNILIELMTNTENTPQDIHNILIEKAIDRFKSQSVQNIFLLCEKHKTMWVQDDDILWYTWIALNENKPSRLDFVHNYQKLRIINNLYYHVMLNLCAIGSIFYIIRYRSDKNFKDKNNSHIIFLFVFISAMIAVHMIVEVAGRYHYPAISIFAILAGYCLANYDVKGTV